jgi:hypothetical protein
MSIEEMEYRYLVSHKLFNISKEGFEKRLSGAIDTNCISYECFPDEDSNLNDSFGNLYGNYFPSRYGVFGSFVSDYKKDFISQKKNEKIKYLTESYSKITPSWLGTSDYVYDGILENQIVKNNFMIDKRLKIVYKDPQVSIYKVLK